MRHSSVWILLLLMFWAVPGYSSPKPKDTTTKQTATIVIAEGNSLLWQPEGRESVVYGAGDSVLVEWDNGTCYVNGQIFQSPRSVPPTIYSVKQLKLLYGGVPSVQEYVRSHAGDETEAWNKAYRKWEKRMGLLTREAARQYMSKLKSGKAADAAAEAAVSTLRASSLVASARVDERSRLVRASHH